MLPRKPSVDYPDLEELTRITVRGAGGSIWWQGRLESSPRQSGDQISISPAAVGYQAALDDDQSAREIFLDCSQASWQGASAQRQIDLQLLGWDEEDASTSADWSTGQPALVTSMTGPWSRAHFSEAWYDAKGIPLSKLLYAWKLQAAGHIGDDVSTDTDWAWFAGVSDDDAGSVSDITASLRAAGPGTGTLAATTATRKFAFVELVFTTAGGNDGVAYPVYWTFLGVVGRHGCPIQGTLGATGGVGILASDALAYALGKWCPELRFTLGSQGTIRPSSYPIEQLAFTDPGGVSVMVTGVTQYELQDWGVWPLEGEPAFYWAPRGTFSRKWRTRVGECQLQETGPQIDRLYNGALVTFTDVSGISRLVGPPGSGANVEDARLLDSDPQNPLNELGETRYGPNPPIAMGTSTPEGAIRVGQAWLQEQKEASTAGSANLVGWVKDDHGVWYPAAEVRAGDLLAVTDAHDPSYRRIVRPEYSDATKTCQVALDQPPDDLQGVLTKLSTDVAPLGFT